MKSLAEGDRPREKFVNSGRHTVSDAELLAILIGSGSRDETAVQLSQRLLADNDNNINRLAKLTLAELTKYKGIGLAKAIHLAAAFELGRRRMDVNATEKVKITSSKIAYQLLLPRLDDLHHEEFWVLYLNRANQVLKDMLMSKGGLTGTVVDVRIICKGAIEIGASAIVIGHNHPSGEVTPSNEDKSITRKLVEALKLLDIIVLDHIIVGEQKYFSFADERLL